MRPRLRRLRGTPAVLLLLGVVTAVGLLGSPASAQPGQDPVGDAQHGRVLFLQSCASCHGTQGEGTQRGPTLQGVGEAAADFYLSTGRMPLTPTRLGVPVQATPGKPAFPPSDIADLVAYVGTLGAGPPIPKVDPGDVSEGLELYLQNCAACHGSSALGYTQVGGRTAPSLYHSTPEQIAEAARVGPNTMPKFDPTTLDKDQLDSIITYVQYLKRPSVASTGGANLGRIGPVTETLVGFAALAVLLIFIRLIGKKSPGKRAS